MKLTVFYICFPFLCSTISHAQWTTQALKGVGVSYGHRWFTMDAFNEDLHLLFFQSQSDHNNNWLTYGYSEDNGRTWSYDTLDGRQGKVSHVGPHISITPFNAAIAVDKCGHPHAFWSVNYFHDKLGPSYAIHAEKIDGEWITDTIYSQKKQEPMVHFDVDIAIGPNNKPYVTFLLGEKTVLLGTKTDKKWRFDAVKNLADARYYSCRLAIDSKNNPHVAVGSVNNTLEYAYKNGNSWQTEVIKETHNWVVDITIDLKDQPHVAYAEGVAKPFKHAVKKGVNWRHSPLEDPNSSGGANTKQARIKCDAYGVLHTIYYKHGEDKTLVYASSQDNGQTWQTQFEEKYLSGYYETSFPDLVITDKIVGLFYKKDIEKPHFSSIHHNQIENRKTPLEGCPESAKEPVVLDTLREIDVQHTIYISDSTVKIQFWDDAQIDGDSISILLNQHLLLEAYRLSKRKKNINFTLDLSKENILELRAINLGTIPPNTCKMVVKSGNVIQVIRLKADLEKSAGIRFIKQSD